MPAPMSLQTRVRQLAALAALATLPLLAGCLGEVAPSRGVSGEAVIDLRGLRVRNQTASPADEVFSARFTIYLITGSSRRAVATKTFTAADMDVADTDEGTIFTITFPYTSADDRFEVEGIGLNAQGETIYQVGPVGFTMKNAASQGGQAAVSVTAPPVYVGPGSTAAKLTISPRSVTLTEGTTATLSATLTDSKGASIPTTSLRIEWWTQNNSVARFNSSSVGVITGGQQPGTTWAYARFD
ncbi:MAG: hypothetical protein H3C62_10365, partial [Gemmatimonadaceae bacterium]|nr:hypothetical protein [Gemmatimonadaceae bacterium]